MVLTSYVKLSTSFRASPLGVIGLVFCDVIEDLAFPLYMLRSNDTETAAADVNRKIQQSLQICLLLPLILRWLY